MVKEIKEQKYTKLYLHSHKHEYDFMTFYKHKEET